MKGLIVRQPWLDLILSGDKTWELRGRRTQHRGEFALIESGSGTVVGVSHIKDVLGPLSRAELIRSFDKHAVEPSDIRAEMPYDTTYAWVLEDEATAPTDSYDHPAGAVIWVNLSDEVARRARRSRV